MFNILGEYKLIKKNPQEKIRLDLDYPLYSDKSIKEDSKMLRLLTDVAKIGLLELEEIPVHQKTIRDVTINNKEVKIKEKVINTKSLYRVTINRKDVSTWIKTKHKYLSETKPYSTEILNIIQKEFGFLLTGDCEHFLTAIIERHHWNLTCKQLYLKNKNRKKLKYDINGNRIR